MRQTRWLTLRHAGWPTLRHAGWFALVLLLLPHSAQAQRVMHRVRFGETLAGISQLYYGTEKHAAIIALANNGDPQQQPKPGDHIRVPTAWVHTVRANTTLNALAKELLGDSRRGPVLRHFNRRIRRNRVRAKTKVVVPFTLAHTVTPSDTPADLARQFYGSPQQAKLLLSHNLLSAPQLKPGSTIDIPIGHVRITPQRMETLINARLLGVHQNVDQQGREALQEANALLRGGDYWSVGLRLVKLLGQQISSDAYLAEVYKLLAISYVALDHSKIAVKAFREALLHQPDLSLDPVTTSPKVIRAFVDAKSSLRAGQ